MVQYCLFLFSRELMVSSYEPWTRRKGFRVEIMYSEEPSEVFEARNRNGTKRGLRRVNYNHYGTRHSSMMRYCAQVPHSIGFVISQDGEVRVISQISGTLVMWENTTLQHHYDFVLRKRTPHKKR